MLRGAMLVPAPRDGSPRSRLERWSPRSLLRSDRPAITTLQDFARVLRTPCEDPARLLARTPPRPRDPPPAAGDWREETLLVSDFRPSLPEDTFPLELSEEECRRRRRPPRPRPPIDLARPFNFFLLRRSSRSVSSSESEDELFSEEEDESPRCRRCPRRFFFLDDFLLGPLASNMLTNSAPFIFARSAPTSKSGHKRFSSPRRS